MKKEKSWDAELTAMAQRARTATAALSRAPAEARTRLLETAAQKLLDKKDAILTANARDVAAAQGKLRKAMIDRLSLDAARMEGMAKGLRAVAAQPDPVGKTLEEWTQPSGLRIARVSVPLGVIGMIYESRPNVTAEAASIALRGGNAIILRSGSDCFESATAITEALREALKECRLPVDAVQIIPTTDRSAVGALLKLNNLVDIIVPRGGRSLIERVEAESRIPLLRQYEGICHVYIHSHADVKKAVAIAHNAKLRRTSICGAAECLLIDRAALEGAGAAAVKDLLDAGCEIRGDEAVMRLDSRVKAAQASDWGKEFLDAVIAARWVKGVDEAAAHIREFGSGHTDCIVTEDKAAAKKFCDEVDSAIVMVNASTQFADGGEFGFGGEVGIATGRLHARGPIGAAQLTSYKYIVIGNGTVRG
ncbi:MAG TPA: glutamate-5-semialdehyde dehydrogenase [Alphaproteobacteria bacterium]|nr:glutamate-5-semialdehyde dehydrogenase [Alphaproteobacteria bacterium]